MTWWPGGNARREMGPQSREAQRPDRRLTGTQRAGVGPAPAQNTIRAQLVVVFGTGANKGIFVYSGSAPAKGNLVATITATTGTDPYGNTYPAGISSLDPVFGGVTQINGAQIQLSAGINILQRINPSGYVIYSPTAAAGNQVASVAPAAFSDSFGNAILAGFTSYTAGLQAELQAASLSWSGTGITVAAAIGSGASSFLQLSSGQTATLVVQAIMSLNSAASGGFGSLFLTSANVDVATVGAGLRVAEGTNAKQGTATLAAGTKLVANTSVTANSRIFLTAQDNNSTGALRVSARVAGTSFTITSSNAADTGVIAFQIFEPG